MVSATRGRPLVATRSRPASSRCRRPIDVDGHLEPGSARAHRHASGDLARTNVFSPPTVKATRPLRFGPAPSIATIRPRPYCGCRTETPGRKASEVVGRGRGRALAARSAAVVSRNRAGSRPGAARARLADAASRTRRAPRRRPRGRGRHRLLGQLGQEARGDGRLPLAAELADPAMAQVELALGPGDADEEQPALLLQLVLVVVGRGVGQEALLQADDEDDGELQPLAACSVISVTAPGLVLPAVDGRGQADLLQEVDDRGPRVLAVELAGGRDQLLDVGQPVLAALLRVGRPGGRDSRSGSGACGSPPRPSGRAARPARRSAWPKSRRPRAALSFRPGTAAACRAIASSGRPSALGALGQALERRLAHPRGGTFTTRWKATSSFGLASRFR